MVGLGAFVGQVCKLMGDLGIESAELQCLFWVQLRTMGLAVDPSS